MYIIFAIIVFGILIAVHELGHFVAAKSLGVQVNEFALGMGPVIYKRQKGETQFSLRAFPVGGFCAMEGEDESSDNPRAFTRQSPWKRAVILMAGSAMNFLTGFLLVVLILTQNSYFASTTLDGFAGEVAYGGVSGLQAGDRIVKIDGEHIYTNSDVGLVMSRSADEYFDVTVVRSGHKVALKNLPMVKQDFVIDGETQHIYGLLFRIDEKTAWNVVKYGALEAMDFVKMVKLGLMDLISGAVGLNEMSGVVGIVDTMNDVGKQSQTAALGFLNVAYLGAFIAVNLSVMNLLPLPALDGGRVFFLIVTGVIEKISKRKLNPKYEGYVHMAGLFLLLGLMVLITANDIMKIAGIR